MTSVVAQYVAMRRGSSSIEIKRQATERQGLGAGPWAHRMTFRLDNCKREEAATRIARVWRKHRYKEFMSRQVFVDRLELEDAVCIGVLRLILFCLIFTFLMQGTAVGVSSTDRLSFMELLDSSLSLDEFRDIRTLTDFQDYMEQVSSALKQFSISSSVRFPNPDGVVIQAQMTELVSPKLFLTVDPPVGLTDFTLSAWVKLPHRMQGRACLLRKPLATQRALSCWGWFHPAQFRFGAHDFHSLSENSGEGEEVVRGGGEAPGPGLSHEAVVVTNSTVAFFRNGQPLGSPQRLPRSITDCLTPSAIELGEAGLGLGAVEFRPRALLAAEIDELFRSGRPLSELATGSQLLAAEEATATQVQAIVEEGIRPLEQALASLSDLNQLSSAIERSRSIPKAPPSSDGVRPAVLLEPQRASALADPERLAWEAAGRPGHINETEQGWRGPDIIAGRYFSAFENPVFAVSTETARIPADFAGDGASDGFALSFWYKPMFPAVDAGPYMWIAPDYEFQRGLAVWMEPSWVDVWLFGEWEEDWLYAGEYTTRWDEQLIDEKHSIGSSRGDLLPSAWRHVTVQYLQAEGKSEVYLDGKVLLDSAVGTHYAGASVMSMGLSAQSLLANSTIKLDDEWHEYNDGNPLGQFAHFRVYPRALTPAEVYALHSASVWSDGEPVRDCIDESTSRDFYDLGEVDELGNACGWYYAAMQQNRQVCNSDAARKMCPMTCAAVQTCHDGSLFLNFTQPAPDAPKFRIFDRIMHLTPRDNAASVICPRADAETGRILAECARHSARGDDFWWSKEESPHFSDPLFYSAQSGRADLRDCEELKARLDREQCEWDGSWLPAFQREFEKSRRWSVSFWVRPTPNSKGMPHAFVPSVHLISRLASPLILADFFIPDAEKEALLEVFSVLRDATASKAPAFPEPYVDLSIPGVKWHTGWTFMWAQMEPDEEWGQRFCVGVNALPPVCWSDQQQTYDQFAFPTNSLVEAVEFTTELLVSPIEVSTRTRSPSYMQRKYYRLAAELAKVRGPRLSEVERRQRLAEPWAPADGGFSLKAALLAPPVVFQTRAPAGLCESRVGAPFFAAQSALINAAHCNAARCPLPAPAAAMACRDPRAAPDASFFGLERSQLGGSSGFSDFLYVISDSALVVRNGEQLPTRRFLDVQTQSVLVLAVFYLPDAGLTTVLELRGAFEGSSVETAVVARHYGYMPRDRKPAVVTTFALLFTLLALVVLLNLAILSTLCAEAKLRQLPLNRKGMLEVFYDLFQASVTTVFAILALTRALASESEAARVVSDVASVPFASPTLVFEAKVSRFFNAVDALNAALDVEEQLSSAAFALMILMLLRIIAATAVHPRTGVLTGTLLHGAGDLWHFTILFLIVFSFFAATAVWLFGSSRLDFSSLDVAMYTQFQMLLGNTPANFAEDARMVVYVGLTSLVMFFLMLNFLLAIVVEGYMRVREDIERNESDQEFLHDVVLTCRGYFKGLYQRWPSKREVAFRLRHQVGSPRVTALHVWLQGFDTDASRKMFKHYHSFPFLRSDPPPWMIADTLYDMHSAPLVKTSSGHKGVRRKNSQETQQASQGVETADGTSLQTAIQSLTARSLNSVSAANVDVRRDVDTIIAALSRICGTLGIAGPLTGPAQHTLELASIAEHEAAAERCDDKKEEHLEGDGQAASQRAKTGTTWLDQDTPPWEVQEPVPVASALIPNEPPPLPGSVPVTTRRRSSSGSGAEQP